MKYLFTRIISFTLLLVLLKSGKASSQIVKRSTTTIEAYIGYPDFYKIIYRSVIGSSGIYNISTKGQGPYGLRLENLLSKRLGIGLDVWYANTRITGVYAPNNTISPSNVSFSANLTRLNGIVRLIIHLSEHEKFDPYLHAGIGYLYSRFNFQSSNKAVYDVKNPLIPVTLRIGIGLKYYVSPELGIVVDTGLGGPLLSIGIFKRWLAKDENN